MAKNIIRLTEEDLKRIVKESVKKVLNEDSNLDDDIDITKIPIEILRRGYFDYRLAPVTSFYGNVLNEPASIKEAVNDILPPDAVVKNIIGKYNLPHELIQKREHFHKICVYAITAVIGKNAELIEDDMNKMGYFLSKKGKITKVENMLYQVLQFEPSSQLQEDITDILKSKFDILYHWTPLFCVGSILRNGLIPNHRNSVFDYPPRTYLMEGDSTDEQRLRLGRLLCAANNNPQNNGKYALMVVSIKGLDEDIRFYYDPNSEIGIYTEQPIPRDKIKLFKVEQLK